MSTPVYGNDSKNDVHRTSTKTLISATPANIDDFSSVSQLSTEKVKELQETVIALKHELQGIVSKVEQNVGIFKGRITSKIALVLNLLKKKQIHIQNTLDNCYKIIDNLVETFINVGHELEKDITLISCKVNDFENELKKVTGPALKTGDDVLWFINDEGRLSKRQNVVLTSALPKFKCGDQKMRRSFVLYLAEIFTTFQVPKTFWVKLAANQLVGMARDWWNMHDKDMSWSQFIESFIMWSFDNCLKSCSKNNENQCTIVENQPDAVVNRPVRLMKMQPLPHSNTKLHYKVHKHKNVNNRMNGHNLASVSKHILKNSHNLASVSKHLLKNSHNLVSASKHILKNSHNLVSASKHVLNPTDGIGLVKSNCVLEAVTVQDTDEDTASSKSNKSSHRKRKHIYTSACKNEAVKRRRVYRRTNVKETGKISNFKSSRYKLRKRQ